MRQTRSVISRLLSNLGSRKEVEQYLRAFSEVDAPKFAVIKAGGAVLQDDLEGLASSLSFLQQVGLYPIVIHGASPQLDAALAERGLPNRRVDGLRVTDGPTLEVARKVFLAENLKLVEALEALGTRARPITSGVFQATLKDLDRYGLVGDVTGVDLEPLRSSIRAGALPILACLGETAQGQIVNVNADAATRAVAVADEPYKIIFLNPEGGFTDQTGEVIPSINLAEDYEDLLAQGWLSDRARVGLTQVERLLSELPGACSVSITSPDHLAQELFTHKGSGTLVRQGERVLRHDGFSGLDRARVTQLLESVFKRQLAPGYFESKPFRCVYVTESYRGIAILTEENGVPYLDKFAVTSKAQGEGLGRSIWLRMKRDHPRLFWRARSANPINPWYFQQSEGTWRADPWTVFWYGITDPTEAMACVARALSLPATLVEHAVSD